MKLEDFRFDKLFVLDLILAFTRSALEAIFNSFCLARVMLVTIRRKNISKISSCDACDGFIQITRVILQLPRTLPKKRLSYIHHINKLLIVQVDFRLKIYYFFCRTKARYRIQTTSLGIILYCCCAERPPYRILYYYVLNLGNYSLQNLLGWSARIRG